MEKKETQDTQMKISHSSEMHLIPETVLQKLIVDMIHTSFAQFI